MISFVIVNYQSSHLLSNLIGDLWSQPLSAGDEIIVVDNFSNEVERNRIVKLSQESKGFKLILNENLGFGQASNLAAKAATGEVIVLVNPDIRVEQVGFKEFIKSEFVQNIRILAPVMKYPNGEVQPNGGGSLSLTTFVLQYLKFGRLVRRLGLTQILFRLIGFLPLGKKSIYSNYLRNFSGLDEAQDFDWVSGAFLIVRRSDYLEIGGFDEKFFLYCEDADFCLRIGKAAGKIVVSPKYCVVHDQGMTGKSGNGATLQKVKVARLLSNLYYARKHFGMFRALSLLLLYLIGEFLVGILILICLQIRVGLETLRGLLKIGNYGYDLMFSDKPRSSM